MKMTKKEHIVRILAVNLSMVESCLNSEFNDVAKLRNILTQYIDEAIEDLTKKKLKKESVK